MKQMNCSCHICIMTLFYNNYNKVLFIQHDSYIYIEGSLETWHLTKVYDIKKWDIFKDKLSACENPYPLEASSWTNWLALPKRPQSVVFQEFASQNMRPKWSVWEMLMSIFANAISDNWDHKSWRNTQKGSYLILIQFSDIYRIHKVFSKSFTWQW